MAKARVIIDTNFLLVPVQFKIDIFEAIPLLLHEPVELCIMEGTLDELIKIAKEGPVKDRIAAKVAMQLVKQKHLKGLASSFKNVDTAILELATEKDYVATQDRELKQKLKAKNVRIITLKSKGHIALG
jgi:uncharacterized protein